MTTDNQCNKPSANKEILKRDSYPDLNILTKKTTISATWYFKGNEHGCYIDISEDKQQFIQYCYDIIEKQRELM